MHHLLTWSNNNKNSIICKLCKSFVFFHCCRTRRPLSMLVRSLKLCEACLVRKGKKRDRERQTEKEGKGGEGEAGRQAGRHTHTHTHPALSLLFCPLLSPAERIWSQERARERAPPSPPASALPPGLNHVIDSKFTQDTLNAWTRSCFVTLGIVLRCLPKCKCVIWMCFMLSWFGLLLSSVVLHNGALLTWGIFTDM